MSFAAAVRSALTQYVTFTGRARRSEYWWYTLAVFLVSLVANLVDQATGVPAVALIVALATLLPSLAVSVRRLHDTGRSGWLVLLGLIPVVGWIILIVFAVQDSQPGANQHGPSPKERSAVTV